MKRSDFLKSTLGICGLSLVPSAFLAGCNKDSVPAAPTNVNFTLDLNSSANAALNTVGGSLIANSILIIRVSTTTFDALSSFCTHGNCTVGYDSASKIIVCPCHGGTFDL